MHIIFEAHSVTQDNLDNVASGWNDAALSPIGVKKAKAWRERYKLEDFDAVFTADLQRGYKTAQQAFPDITTKKLFMDWRLRECDYGDLTQAPKDKLDTEKLQYITNPFPNGESYAQAMARMKSFVDDLKTMPYKNVLIVGSRATHYGLDIWINGRTIEDCLKHKFIWRPGWKYEL